MDILYPWQSFVVFNFFTTKDNTMNLNNGNNLENVFYTLCKFSTKDVLRDFKNTNIILGNKIFLEMFNEIFIGTRYLSSKNIIIFIQDIIKTKYRKYFELIVYEHVLERDKNYIDDISIEIIHIKYKNINYYFKFKLVNNNTTIKLLSWHPSIFEQHICFE